MVGVALALLGTAEASKRCGNSWIADNKVCRIGTAAPYTPPAPVRTSAPVYVPPVTRFGSCDEARAAGHSDIPRSSASYSPGLDRDGDGVACEAGGEGEAAANAPAARLPTPPCPAAAPNIGGAAQLQARPMRVFDVQGYPYVHARAFACANGLSFLNDGGTVTVSGPGRTLVFLDKAGTLNGKSWPLNANVLTIEDDIAVFYADLLSAFGLTVDGQQIVRVPGVPLSGQRP
ncbi:Excalibur calcium-binding domain-containing protein [Deinococcus reticulitermitis]|uniref:Excalibur calcium-binding domain-containing protein n=2 Tax=Deinococcus reticulitermitis TaxID=856736 RepID=A0A1H6SIP5_9DEIO|nr:Excalibur calcium-binding domain-containing protein [Deinococcus reticulitermitis]